MPDPTLLILFGLPGAGKSFAGRLLRDEFGFHFHEADDDLPPEYRALAAAGQVASDDLRDSYHRLVVERIAGLHARHPRLAVALPLLRDRHRLWIRQRFPDAVFVLVACDAAQREARLALRQHAVTAAYARQVMGLWEAPSFEHHRLDDTAFGSESVRAQLSRIVGLPPDESQQDTRDRER